MDPRERRAKRSGEPQGIGAVLEELGRGRRLAAGLALGRLARRWGDVVGERLAEESAPLRLEGGLLLVRVSSAAWATQVTFLAGAVAKGANGVLGSEIVRTVKVVVGEGGAAEGRWRGRQGGDFPRRLGS